MQGAGLSHSDKVCFPAPTQEIVEANYQHSLENLQASTRNTAAYENRKLLIQYRVQTYVQRQYAVLSHET